MQGKERASMAKLNIRSNFLVFKVVLRQFYLSTRTKQHHRVLLCCNKWYTKCYIESRAHFFLAHSVESCNQSVAFMSGDYTDFFFFIWADILSQVTVCKRNTKIILQRNIIFRYKVLELFLICWIFFVLDFFQIVD